MSARPRRWSFLAFGLAAISLASPAAQDQPQLTPFRTEVHYIRVDMYPTAGGAPVPDLTQAEVEILDGGVPQKNRPVRTGARARVALAGRSAGAGESG